MKNIKQINKILWLKIGLTLIFVSSLSSILIDSEYIILIRCLNGVTLFSIAFITFVYFGLNKIVCFLNDKFIEKDSCPYYSKDQCPYGSISKCPYNISGCYAFPKSQKSQKKSYWLFTFVIIAILIIVISTLYTESGSCELFNWDVFNTKDVLTILQTISISFIGAVCVAYLFDIPGRMAEYQNYFINLLSSSDYLKKMEEKDLLELRSRITWLLHIKDVPNMPKGLIAMDKKICKMLKEPYFKEYTQIVSLVRNEDPKAPGTLQKKISIEYIAFNPYNTQHPVIMDIGLANSVNFGNEVSIEKAKELFKLIDFTVYVDSDESKYDLKPHIDIKIAEEKEDGLLYNGKILLAPRGNESNKETPLNISSLTGINKTSENNVNYEITESSTHIGLYMKFADKIKVKLQYEITVPEEDVTFTKRLRYPVKYFHIDYTLGQGLDDYFLAGQLLGTLIDQNNISVEILQNKRHICMKTHSWLLPKNGVVIVHCKSNENAQDESDKSVNICKT